MKRKELVARINALKGEAAALNAATRSQDGAIRAMTDDEKRAFDAKLSEIRAAEENLERFDATQPIPAYPVVEGRSQNPGFVPNPVGDAPAVHTEERTFSFLRALQLSFERHSRPYDGVEGEIHAELLKRRTSGVPPEGILLPLGNEPEFRSLMYTRAQLAAMERRDLTTTTGTGAVFVTPDLPFIELLRNKMVLRELGATFLTGLQGKIAIPRQNAASTAYWVAEGVSLTTSNPTLDQVPLTDKTLGAISNISRKFMYQTSVDAENFVKNDLAQVLAIELDRAGLNGSGSGAVPLGILQNSTVQTNSVNIQGGANGAVPTFAQLVAMESLVAGYNADRGSLKYLMAPALRGTLKTTVKNAGTGYPIFLFEGGEVNGHPAVVSNQIPVGMTKGTSTNCTYIVYGNWNDLIIGQWGGIDTVVNPYTNQANGAVTISMMTEADVAVRHPESFAVVMDAKVA